MPLPVCCTQLALSWHTNVVASRLFIMSQPAGDITCFFVPGFANQLYLDEAWQSLHLPRQKSLLTPGVRCAGCLERSEHLRRHRCPTRDCSKSNLFKSGHMVNAQVHVSNTVAGLLTGHAPCHASLLHHHHFRVEFRTEQYSARAIYIYFWSEAACRPLLLILNCVLTFL